MTFLVHVIYQWSDVKAPHLHLTMMCMKLEIIFYLRQSYLECCRLKLIYWLNKN